MTTIRNTALLIWCLIYSACSTSCTFQVSADGAKSFAIDGEQAAKAIRVLTEK